MSASPRWRIESQYKTSKHRNANHIATCRYQLLCTRALQRIHPSVHFLVLPPRRKTHTPQPTLLTNRNLGTTTTAMQHPQAYLERLLSKIYIFFHKRMYRSAPSSKVTATHPLRAFPPRNSCQFTRPTRWCEAGKTVLVFSGFRAKRVRCFPHLYPPPPPE